ncbi:hypothetical protein HH310_17810 [Actinoplanes sp. TBRC 11911]|uniref:hypothetical protein n=1 Tax=Actinoplanes sp. TBRC 11911 TaxID=2729386 RepID=UPI00145E452C|nr:hypothetical protein [Actinoplanes sp. TBRC 11911]NMO53038.1 hypothetical protein [Actinoplanes sp. TBRC 11911]
MFPYADAQSRLDINQQRIDDMLRLASSHRQARAVSAGRQRRLGRWPRRHRSHATVTA